MAGRRTNLALLIALATAVATGAAAFAVGTPAGAPIVVAHGVAGVIIIVLAPWKSVVVRRGLARRRRGRAASLVLTALIVTALVAGLGHSTGLLRSFGFVTAMQVHVAAALIALPVALVHVLRRPVRLDRSDLGRRQILRAGTVVAAGGVAYAALEGVARLSSLPGSGRRFTGSFATGSHAPDRMPVTQWLNDRVPLIEVGAWRLRVTTTSGTRSLPYDAVAAWRDALPATLDCTGGWYSEQDWEGVWVARLIGEARGRSIAVTSSTGYERRFPLRDATNLLVATRVGGRPLSPGHGYPARLVAPGRRGFWWVKWIVAIEVDDVPWWAQPPFPLT